MAVVFMVPAISLNGFLFRGYYAFEKNQTVNEWTIKPCPWSFGKSLVRSPFAHAEGGRSWIIDPHPAHHS